MKTIRLSVQEFAQPTPRSGSLSVGGPLRSDTQKGIELHQRVQKKRKAQFPEYKSEKKLTQSFTIGEWTFAVEGRCDGIYEGIIPRIEEIKTTRGLKSLAEALERDPYSHPYGLQLMTYGYIVHKEQNVVPELTFHLISTRDDSARDLPLLWELERFEAWLKVRLEDLAAEAERGEKRVARRKKLVTKLQFPFPKPRPGQLELVERLEADLEEGKNVLLQAPTGLGKTMGVLYPTLKEALARGQKVIWVTPKNSQQQVAEESLELVREQGCKVKSLTLTAKSKICPKTEVLCDPLVCEFAKDYYDKFERHKLREVLAEKRSLSARTLKKLGGEFEVCPYELQLDAVREADIVIGDYNHALAERGIINTESIFEASSGKPILVIDEAHNLPSRTMAQYSPMLSAEDFVGDGLLRECRELLLRYDGPKRVIELELEPFEAIQEKFQAALAEAEVPEQALIRASFAWANFTSVLAHVIEGHEQFFISAWPGGRLKITCCDASELIRPKYEAFEHVVAFSATIRPFEFYSGLSGLSGEKLATHEFFSPYPKERRKILVIPQISTRYTERDRNYGKVAEVISRISQVREGNYLAFFPSFDFMEKTVSLLNVPGLQVIRQSRQMKRDEVETVLNQLKASDQRILLCGVQGGVFSEGIDYPGDMVIGAFIVGPPLPSYDFERERMKEYYEASYKQGHRYAYSYPAMTKAVQAAGRVIRSESDRGVIILMDDRFLLDDYSSTMPGDWFATSPRELVSSSILSELKDFWDTV